MPWGLERWHGGDDLHFVTFSCYRRQALLPNVHRRQLFLKVLGDVRRRYQWVDIGYVVMPEHFHLLMSEPDRGTPSTDMQILKQRFARRLHGAGDSGRVWQERFYDFNVWSEKKEVEKLRYIHRNPVKRGLVELPEQWVWSNFRSYAYGEVGPVRIRSQEWPLEIRRTPVTRFTFG